MLGFVCVELEYYFNNNPPAALERHYAAFRPPFSKGGGVMGQSPVSPFAKGEILIKIKRRRVRPAANRDVCLGENNKLTARLEQNILRLCPRWIKILFNNNFPVTFPWHFAARRGSRAANRGV